MREAFDRWLRAAYPLLFWASIGTCCKHTTVGKLYQAVDDTHPERLQLVMRDLRCWDLVLGLSHSRHCFSQSIFCHPFNTILFNTKSVIQEIIDTDSCKNIFKNFCQTHAVWASRICYVSPQSPSSSSALPSCSTPVCAWSFGGKRGLLYYE